MATVELKSINELFGESFWVPAYQRGYRWSKVQIEELLEDLYDFAVNRKENDYYCLQPIIVKKKDKFWELVDGQQRLTALRLISALYYCSHREDILGLSHKKYLLQYEEKEAFSNLFDKLDAFVEDGTFSKIEAAFADDKKISIDARYLIDSINCIVKYTRGQRLAKGVLSKIFDVIDHINVIWYVLEDDADAIQTFTNINANKIELTNSELLKAVLLHANNDENAMQNMAIQWETIEKALNNNSFWNFIFNSGKKEQITRMDYLFEIWISKEKSGEIKFGSDKHALFREINAVVSKGEKAKECTRIWKEIQQLYETLNDWYNEYELYHLIGLLIIINDKSINTINELYSTYSNSSKKAFKSKVLGMIKAKYFGHARNLPFDEMSLEAISNDLNDIAFQDHEKVKSVLLLYNIAMLVNANNTYERFPFDLYKEETWDIEHINPQTPQEASDEEKKEWLTSYKTLLSADDPKQKELIESIDTCISTRFRNFSDVADRIKKMLEITDVNSISNLVLLDASTNRGYKNDCFAAKRKKIIEIERKKSNDEKYIPIGTKWVFLKGFENAKQLVVWSTVDMRDYINDVSANIFKMMQR